MSSVYITNKRPASLIIDVLGTKYDIVFKTPEEEAKLLECDGYCDNSIREIGIRWFEYNDMNYNDMLSYTSKVIRHELIHAFLYQSGLDINTNKEWARNEEMVDWLALQLPKISYAATVVEEKFYKANKENVITKP